ncbi:hypothetical protein D3C80_2051670 [compost metagenome]
MFFSFPELSRRAINARSTERMKLTDLSMSHNLSVWFSASAWPILMTPDFTRMISALLMSVLVSVLPSLARTA